MRAFGRVIIRIFFRRVEVEGAARLPPGGPTLVVANHTNGLVDGLLLIAMLERYPRFLGKATLFRIPPLKPLLRLAGVVPIYRQQDGGGTAGNDAAFRRCHELLGRGGVVAIFPEGISHDEASLQPLRTGAARLALGAPGACVVPVGLSYDNKARFRSRALVTIGDAIDVVPDGDVRALTEQIDSALRAVSPDFASNDQAVELATIAEIVAWPEGLRDRERIARALATAEPAQLAQLRAAHAVYARDLALLGVRDGHVAATTAPSRHRAAVLWSTTKLVAAAPVAAVGYGVHVLPYLLVKQLAKAARNEGVKSTAKILGCLVLFTVEYLVLAVLAWRGLGPAAAALTIVGCPLAGYAAVRFLERVYAAGGLRRSYRTLRAREATLASVRANRQRLVEVGRAVADRTTGADAGDRPSPASPRH